MGIILRRTDGGHKIYPYWIGRWENDGKRHETTLCRWKGTPPAPGEKRGDAAFEKSRGEAEALFKRIREGEKSKEEEAALVQKIHAARYGGKVDRVKLADLSGAWDALPHKADLTEERRARVHSVLARFVGFMGERFPNVKEAGALTTEHFKAFLEAIDESGVSARTWNDYMETVRSVLRKVDGQGRGFREYLANLPKRSVATVHRRPFDGNELEAILTAAAEVDPELRPVLLAAACTALRRGDVCRLRWDSIDLEEGFVTVKTSKTGETVDIPIFPPFRSVLEEAALVRKKGVPYVFPKVALAYQRNPYGLNWRLGKVLAAAGFAKPEPKAKTNPHDNAGKYEAPEDAEAAEAMVEDGMEREGWTARRKAKARQILALHFEGLNGKQIAEEIGTSRGGVSDYFKAMEKAGRVAIVSTPKRDTPARATLAEIQDGEQRKLRGNLAGFHAFRTTFCTLALANGVPMEILQKITGHRTTEIVLKHYDRRGRDAMRKAFGAAMPRAIAGAVEVEGADLPPELGKMLSEATPAQLAKVAKMLAKGKGGAK